MLVNDGGVLKLCQHSNTFNASAGMTASDCALQGGTLSLCNE